MPSLPFRLIAVFAFLAMAGAADAQWFKRSSPTPQGRPGQPMMQSRPGQPMQLQPQRPASQLIQRQPPLKINQKVLNQCTPDNVHVVVSIPKQRALLMLDEQVAADSPISSGKKGHSTPTGKFTILEKDPNHHSTIYGDFCDSQGRVVRAGVSAHIDAAPSGTHFVGAAMTWFMRLTGDGVGMHIGILPGYAASHGCVRMSSDGAKLFYDHVKVGTPVAVGDY